MWFMSRKVIFTAKSARSAKKTFESLHSSRLDSSNSFIS